MKILHLAILITVAIISVSLLDDIFAQTAGHYLRATMNKLNYQNSEKPVITVFGYPNSTVDFDVYDSLSQDIFSAHIQISSSGVANYTLDISSYKVGIYSAEVRTSTDRVKISFAVGLMPTGPVLTLTTTKDHYVPEEIIDASGRANPNSLIYLNLLDPTNVTADSAKEISDNFGFFSVHFRVPQNAVNGTWRIEASSGTNYRVVDIAIISSNYFTLETKPSPKVVLNETLTKVMTPSHVLPPTPLKQFKSGIKAEDVKCNSGLILAIKLDYSPACVTKSSATKLFLRGWALGFTNYQPVYFMEPNSTARISVKYYPHNYQGIAPPDMSIPLQSWIYDLKSDYPLASTVINATAEPDYIHTNSITIVNYTITSGNTKGVYWLSILDPCVLIPIAVNLDETQLTTSDLQNPGDSKSCPAPEAQFHVVGVSNATLKLVHLPSTNENISSTHNPSQISNSSSVLKLYLSADSSINPAQPLNVDISLNNTSSQSLTLVKQDNWRRNDLALDSCSSLPYGIAILKGYYTEQNMTGAGSLVLYPIVPCPRPPTITSYTLQPLSNIATQECNDLFGCPGKVEMKSHLSINGFLDYNGQHRPFNTGTYTLVGGDEWGDVAIRHFTVEYGTLLNENSGYNENKNVTNGTAENSKITHMDLKAYGFVCCGIAGDLLKGNLSSNTGPISDANVAISINGIIMGYAKTYPDGCFQFNQWNDSKLSEQTNEFLANEKNSGVFGPFNLAFSANYAGDDNNHYPASANATSSMYLTAIPLPPPQLEATVTPSEVNVTQGSSSNLQISVKPMVEQWAVTQMSLYLEGLPCGVSYQVSQASDNNTSSTTHPAVFDISLNTATYSPEGMYFVHMVQNGTNSLVAHDIGTFSLNILKMR